MLLCNAGIGDPGECAPLLFNVLLGDVCNFAVTAPANSLGVMTFVELPAPANSFVGIRFLTLPESCPVDPLLCNVLLGDICNFAATAPANSLGVMTFVELPAPANSLGGIKFLALPENCPVDPLCSRLGRGENATAHSSSRGD